MSIIEHYDLHDFKNMLHYFNSYFSTHGTVLEFFKISNEYEYQLAYLLIVIFAALSAFCSSISALASSSASLVSAWTNFVFLSFSFTCNITWTHLSIAGKACFDEQWGQYLCMYMCLRIFRSECFWSPTSFTISPHWLPPGDVILWKHDRWGTCEPPSYSTHFSAMWIMTVGCLSFIPSSHACSKRNT